MVLDLRFCGVACASEDSGTQFALLLITVSLERIKTSDDADIKVEVNTNPPNANVQASESEFRHAAFSNENVYAGGLSADR